MKNEYQFSALVLLLILTTPVYAQIPNSGFENWTNKGSYMNPVGWWTANDSASTGSFYPATRSNDHYPPGVGSYSLRLENNLALLPNWGGYGITWTGDFSGNDLPVFAVSGHPESLWGYFKFLPQNNDTMEVHIRLYKNGIDVGGGSYKNATAISVWTPFSINFSTYADADSARIMMSACYDNDAPIPHGNSVLYVDNLNFDSLLTVGIAENEVESMLIMYPNPANDFLAISLPEYFDNRLDAQVFNVFGQCILTQELSHTSNASLDISQLEVGMYVIYFSIEEKFAFTKKLLIIR